MRIFKNVPNLCECVAGEIINLLTGIQYFDAGVKLDVAKPRYPLIVIGNIEMVPDLYKVHVSMPSEYQDVELQNAILKRVEEFAKSIPPSDKWVIKPETSINTFKRNKFEKVAVDLARNRILFRSIYLGFGYSNKNDHYSMNNRDLGIFIDLFDLSVYQHNDVTYELSMKSFVGYNKILYDTKIHIDYTSNPIARELSSLNYKKTKYIFMTKPSQFIRFEECDIGENPVCDICKTLLYDDNYVFTGNIISSNYKSSVIICPCCVHYSNDKYHTKYANSYIVTVPTTINDIIDLKYTDELAHIMHTIADSIRYYKYDSTYFAVAEKNEHKYVITYHPERFITSACYNDFKDYTIIKSNF